MNERVKAILHTALRLSPDEREKLARVLLETLDSNPENTDQMFLDLGITGSDDETQQLPTSDILQLYLDV